MVRKARTECPERPRQERLFMALYLRAERAPADGLEDILRAQRDFFMAKARFGELLQPGQFEDDSGAAALVRAHSIEAAEKLVRSDPAVRSGLFSVEVRPWSPADRSAINAETARRLFESVTERNGAMLFECYSPDVRIHEAPSLPYGGSFAGIEGAMTHAAAFLANWGELQGGAERRMDEMVLADEARAVVLWRHRARNPQTGEQLDVPVVSVYEMGDGRIVDSRMFHFDPEAVADFLARARSAGKPSESARESA